MKKLLALSLAALLALSLSVTAFAGIDYNKMTPDLETNRHEESVAGFLFYGQGFFENDDNQVELYNDDTTLSPGESVYYPLRKAGLRTANYTDWDKDNDWYTTGTTYDNTKIINEIKDWGVTKSDAVKSVSVSATWTLNKEMVESARVVQKKWIAPNGDTGYAYFLAISARSSTLTTQEGIAGNLTVKKSSGTLADANSTTSQNNNQLKFSLKFDVSETIGFPKLLNFVITDETKMYRASENSDEGEQSFELEKFENATFDVDVTGQGRILLYADAKYNSAVANKYPSANIDFLNGNGANWNKIGELKIPAEIGSFIYGIDADNNLFALTNCEYDEYEEAFIVKTRAIGKYAISDIELDIASSGSGSTGTEEPAPEAPEPEAPGEVTPEDPNKNIPNTGAKA